MPTRPGRVCSSPGCPNLRPCPKHPERRPFANRRPHTDPGWVRSAWSKAVLARDPVCVICGQRPSTEAHHVKAEADGGRATMENGAGLCGPCHERITQAQVKERQR